MTKQLKKFSKDVKKLLKRIESCKGLTLKSSFDTSASIVKKGRENSPYVTINAKGDYSISLVKLLLIVIGVSAAVTSIVLAIKSVVESIRKRKRKRELEEYQRACDDIIDF